MDVGGWLRGLGLGQYEANFRDNKINAALLPRLTNDDLKDIGVSALGDRLQLLDAIAALAGAKPPAAKPSPPKDSQVSAERRPITVMFCDLVGSTSLAAKLDPEDWRNLVSAYLDEATKAVSGLGGHVLKRLGDGLMALFGYPQAQENDAERAVRAALAIQRSLAEINIKNRGKGAPDLLARIGIESGSVVVEATGEVFGEAPNVAARVQAAAEPGSVLVTMNVQRQVAGLFVAEERGAQELKGVTEPVQLFRIIRASGGGRRGGARVLTPFVGREEELGLLARRWERARAGEGQLVLIVGEPGLGKSRLIDEFHSQLGETPHTWLEWSSSQLLQNTPLHPIAEWGRQRFGAEAPAEQRLADLEGTLQLIGLDPSKYAPLLAPLVDIPLPPARAANFSPEELRRRQLAAMTTWVLAGARSQSAVVAFEDLHWADPTSLDLLRGLAERGAQAPLLLLATVRPEFRPPWSLRSHHSIVSLRPLDRAGVARMVGEISASHALSKEVVEGVNQRTGGVPLFVEEVTRLLLERGEQGGVQAIPPTLQQSLAARLDRLGPAREVAQIGAVVGRDFAYPLLRDVAELDEPALQASLDRLADADLLFVKGAPPQASYRFKHALIQDAAYDSLLKSRRQALHRRAAEILRDDPERATAAPEVIAHHFTQAGLDDLAIEWWGRAGDQALRRSAFQEAIAHLGKAIGLADNAAGVVAQSSSGDAAGSSRRLKLQTDYGQALLWTKGLVAEETKASFDRTRALAGSTANGGALFSVYYEQWTRGFIGGDLALAQETAKTFLREAVGGGYAMEAVVGHRLLGSACLLQGDLRQARTHFERALADYVPNRDGEARFRFGVDTRIVALGYLALACWHLGEIGRSRLLIEQAIRVGAESDHPTTLAFAYNYKVVVEARRGDAAQALGAAERLTDLSRERGLDEFFAAGQSWSRWARARLLGSSADPVEFGRPLAIENGRGNRLGLPFEFGLVGELEAATGNLDGALAWIGEGLAIAEETGEHYTDSFLHRLRGEVLWHRAPADLDASEDAFRGAIVVAKRQGARSFELRAALSLAKLYQSTARPADAHTVLASALEGFSPTPEMPEIAEAQALLSVLADTEEVRAVAAQRRRRLSLQTSYAQALMWGKGYTAEETKAAFTRIGELTTPDETAVARFVAYDAQCVRSFTRGEYSEARERAETFLREAEAGGYATEAGAARRMLGLILLHQGELAAARSVLDKTLANYVPERDGETQVRFGRDTEVSASAYLALANWHMGEVEHARHLIDRAARRADQLGHVAAIALALFWKVVLESRRDDVLATSRAAASLLDLAEKHNIKTYADYGQLYAYWAQGRLGDAEAGLSGLRQALAAHIAAQGDSIGAKWYHGMLAELELAISRPQRALSLIDQALAIAKKMGGHFNEPYLHRLRGDILRRHNPADPAAAEDAYRTAIAIAKQHGARSYELIASLSLAKLYQSTARPVDAHAVLAPALEGFSPTPEMPEIAEAQALLESLARIGDGAIPAKDPATEG
jgi:class 3 adenylate cyclase/predicted ATPase